MRRVLFTASTYSHIVNFHRPYLREFRRLGWQADVACGGRPMEIPEADRIIDVPFEKSITSVKNLGAVRLLRREIAKGGYDLISCHTSLAAFFTRLAVMGMKGRPKVVCTVHGYLFDDDTPRKKRSLLAAAEAMAAPVTDLLMTMNAWDARYAAAHRLGRTLTEIPGIGLDLTRLRPLEPDTGAALRRQYGFTAEHFLLVYAAEFSARKNQSMLIRMLPQLPERVGLLLPGDGALREDCMALARELGVADRIAFPGQARDMVPWYSAADGAISSSRSEGLPFNVMEAMYYGLPVVASAVKGHTDLIRQGENGLLYPYDDADGCAKQLRALLEQPARAVALGQQASADVARYSLPNVLPLVMEAYEALLPLAQAEERQAPALH